MRELVLREDRDGIAVLTLNRAARRNAMTPELMEELAAQLRRPAPRAFVLTGAEPAFCVGADLKWLGSLAEPGEGVAKLVAAHHEAIRAMRATPVPVVTAVNGAAAGGGMSLALAGDYCVAGAAATFTAANFRLALTPDGGNSTFLPACIGRARTMGLLLSNRRLSAAEALEWGLVNEVAAAPGSVVERACTLAGSFGTVPGETLLATRRLLDGSLEPRLQAEERAVGEAARRPEFREALRGFLER